MDTAKLKRFLIILVLLFVGAQFVQPKRTNPPVIASQTIQAHINVPRPVQAILSRACYNCHSNLTVWPWYSHVAPVSWGVIDHVNEGRRHMNFSDWIQLTPEKTTEVLQNICTDTREKKMPLLSYRLFHPEAHLSAADVNTLCSWTKVALNQSH